MDLRAPQSSRGLRVIAQNSLSVTMESNSMKELFGSVVMSSRGSFAVPLIVDDMEREQVSFCRRVLKKIDSQCDLEIVTPDNGIPVDHFVGGLYIIGAQLMDKKKLLKLEERDFPGLRVCMLAFPNEDAYRQARSKFSIQYIKRLAQPVKWPALRDRAADRAGIIDAIWRAITPITGHVPRLSDTTRFWLENRPINSTDQLFTNMSEALKVATDLTNDELHPGHFEEPVSKTTLPAVLRSAEARPGSTPPA